MHPDQPGLLRESQCGFRKGKILIDLTLTARQLQAKCVPLLDLCKLTNAFDIVSCDSTWKKSKILLSIEIHCHGAAIS